MIRKESGLRVQKYDMELKYTKWLLEFIYRKKKCI